MFTKLTSTSSSPSTASRSPTLQASHSPGNLSGAGTPSTISSFLTNTDAVETRFFNHTDIKAIESGENKLDEILKKFLECFERYKYDESGVDLFDSFSSMLEFKKHFTAILSDFPELSTTNISTDLNKLLALLADRDENVIEPAFHLMSDLHSLLHERIYHLTGQISCSIKRDSKESSDPGQNEMTLEDIKKTFEDNKANVKLPSAERILITAGERGVSKAFDAGEVFSKYLRDCLSYIEKKLALDLEYCVKLFKISHSYNFSAVDESYATLPLWGTVSFMNLQDKEYCKKMNEVTVDLQNRKFVDSLRSRKQEFDDLRKEIRDMWEMEERQYTNTCLLVKKARDNYWLKQTEVSRLEQSSSESEKRQRQMIDAKDRLLDTKIKYDKLIAVANAAQKSVKDERQTAIVGMRELILQAELKIQSSFINYFKMVTGMYQLRPVQYKHLVEQSRSYVVENFYKDQLMNIILNDPDLPAQQEEEFKIQNCPNVNLKGTESKASRLFSISSTAVSNVISSKSRSTDDGPTKRASNLSSMLTVPSPFDTSRHTSVSDFTCSDAGKTHSFIEVERDPNIAFQCTFCVECDIYVFYEALLCRNCSKAIHTGCLSKIRVTCTQAKEAPRRTLKIFSVELGKQPQDSFGIPIVLSKCIQQIESEFLDIRGLYRTEGAKAKVQMLCQKFEDCHSSIDLSTYPPQVLCSLVKHFFRVLPHHLMDTNLTEDWQDVGRCYRALKEEEKPYQHLIQKSIKLVGLLSHKNQLVLKYFLRHLRKISEHSSLNKMNAYNLGRVFGPTLISNKKDDQTYHSGRLDQEVSELDNLSAVIEMFIDDYPKLFDSPLLSTSSDPILKDSSKSGSASPLDPTSEPELVFKHVGSDPNPEGGAHSRSSSKRSLQGLSKMHGTVSIENTSTSPTLSLQDPTRLSKFESTQSFDPSDNDAKTPVFRSSSSTPNIEKS